MKTSFVATVFNEEKEIEEFLKSILQQTKKPDEIIIVDAGSRDKTQSLIQKYHSIKLFVKKGNRSTGRNYGIKKAIGDVIIVSDAGCVLDKNFIKNILSPFNDKKIDVVSGFYYPITNNVFEKCIATYTCIMPGKIDKKNFLPSSRSIAFIKSAWSSVGGYPEELDTCEDLIFAVRMKKEGYRFKFIKNAFVHWRQQKNILQAFKQFYSYAKGDGEARYFRPQTPFLYLRYLLGVLIGAYYIYSRDNHVLYFILISLVGYLLWSIRKNYLYIRNWRAFFYLPEIQLTSDIAVLAGTTIGISQNMLKKRNDQSR